MKKLLILLFVGLISIISKAQNELPKAIQDINTSVEKINKELGDLTILNSLHFSKPYAHSICINNNQITKIREYKPVSKEVLITEYYFKYGRLVFVRSSNVGEDTGEEDLLQKEYLISDTNFRKGYFNYDELISQDYLLYEGKDTLFWGVRMQEQGYILFDKYRKYLNYNPYKTLEFDSVVAYDFDGRGGGAITNGKGRLDKTAKNATMLSRQQIDSLIETVTDTVSYGGFSAACFDPHMGIVFYKEGKVASKIDVCFSCNFLASSEILHATSYHLLRDFKEDYMINSPRYGFTPLGRKKLRTLCSQLGLKLCPKEDSIWDKAPED